VVLFLGAWNTPLPNIGSVTLATWTTGTIWGITLDTDKNPVTGWCTNVDTVDTATLAG
jgi:hypothetical protein